jgi:ubiquinone biosynthesis protein
MRRFILRVTANAIALTLTLRLLSLVRLPATGQPGGAPLLDIPPGGPYLVLNLGLDSGRIEILVAVIFAVMTAILPPILATLFGRWYLRYPIWSYVLGNAALFWVVAQAAGAFGSPFRVPEPSPLWLIVDSVVFTAVIVGLDLLFGLHQPVIRSGDTHGRIWAFIERMPGVRTNRLIQNFRLYEVWNTILSYAMDIVSERVPLSRVRRVVARIGGEAQASESGGTPARIRRMLEQLGPTYVKLGQLVSSRREMMPPEWADELSKLQSAVPPFPWDVARETIRAELHADPEQLFSTIDQVPLAAASLAQVHRATLPDGTDVVVKVQRPEVRAKVRADLGVMRDVAEVAEARFEFARRIDATGIVREFSEGVLQELDYGIEAYNARRLADVLVAVDGVAVPVVHTELSTSRVLVMDFVDGVKATDADRLDPSVDRERVARRLVRALIKQVLVDGFFHADPHPGNVLIAPATGELWFLDLGLVGELRPEQRIELLGLVWALKARDRSLFATVARKLLRPTGPVDESAVRESLERIFYRVWLYGQGTFGDVTEQLMGTLSEHNLRLRSELTLAIKALTQAEELVSSIAPGLPLVDIAVEEAEQLLRDLAAHGLDELWQGGLTQAAGSVLAHATELGQHLVPLLVAAAREVVVPSLAGSARGGPLVSVGVDLEGVADSVNERIGRLASAIVLAGVGLIAGLSVLAFYLRPTAELTGIDLLVLLAPTGAAVYLVLALRSWRRQDLLHPAGGSRRD